MYAANPGSPETTIVSAIDEDDTSITVTAVGSFLAATNLACLWDDMGNFEVVQYTNIAGSVLTVVRGFEGTARAWGAGAYIANLIPAYAINSLQNNVNELKSDNQTWTEVTGTTQAMAVNRRYIANNAAQVVFTLPSIAAVGDVIEVAGKGAGGWRISQNASQQIVFGSVTTTSGPGGYMYSNSRYESVKLLCLTANTLFTVLRATGNPELI